MKKIMYVTIGAILFACKPSSTVIFSNDCFGVYFDYSIEFFVRDSTGQDLLDRQNKNSYVVDNIRVFHRLTDGTIKEDTIPNGWRAWEIERTSQGYIMSVVLRPLNSQLSNGKDPTLYIHWNSEDIDTIDATLIYRRGNPKDTLDAGYCDFFVWDKVLYNGSLIAEDWKASLSKPIPIIIKEGNEPQYD